MTQETNKVTESAETEAYLKEWGERVGQDRQEYIATIRRELWCRNLTALQAQYLLTLVGSY